MEGYSPSPPLGHLPVTESVVLPPDVRGLHHAIIGSPVRSKPHSNSAPPLSRMPGSNGPGTHQTVADRLRNAHVSGRRLRSRRQGRHQDLFDEVDVFGAARAGVGSPSVGRLFPRVQASGPSSPGDELGPSERREGGSRHSSTADHIDLVAAVQFCSLSRAQLGAAHLHTRQSCVGRLRNSSLTEHY